MAGQQKSSGKHGSLTDDERRYLMRLKLQLNAEGVPRNEWAPILQQEITQYRLAQRQKVKQNPIVNENQSGFRKAIQSLVDKVKKLFLKVMLRNQGESPSEEQFKQMMRSMQGQDGNNGGFGSPSEGSGFNEPEVVPPFESLGQNTTFLTPDAKKKPKEVFFDDEDNSH